MEKEKKKEKDLEAGEDRDKANQNEEEEEEEEEGASCPIARRSFCFSKFPLFPKIPLSFLYFPRMPLHSFFFIPEMPLSSSLFPEMPFLPISDPPRMRQMRGEGLFSLSLITHKLKNL